MPLTKRERAIASKYRKYERAKDEAKKFYDRADRLLIEIADAMLIHRRAKNESDYLPVRLPVRISDDGRLLQIAEAKPDEKGILGWGHAAVRQFSLKVVNP